MRPRTLTFSSRVSAPIHEVWEHATSFTGINFELMPVLRMTAQGSLRDLDIGQVVLGERLFRSWILLLGVVPVDYDDISIAEVDPGRRFLERSSMLSVRVWSHERVLEPLDDRSCSVTDRVQLVARLGFTAPVLTLFVGFLFRHRHRRLAGRFG